MNAIQTIKVQLDATTKAMKKEFTSLDELNTAVIACFPKRLAGKTISLKYSDNEGDSVSILEESDVHAFKEFVASLEDKKATLVITVTGKNKEEAKEKPALAKVDSKVVGITKALEAACLDEAKESSDDKAELKEFKFAEAFAGIEALLNSDDKVKPGQLFRALIKATEGTKAEVHLRRFLRKMRHGHGGPHHGFGKMFKRCHKGESSESPEKH